MKSPNPMNIDQNLSTPSRSSKVIFCVSDSPYHRTVTGSGQDMNNYSEKECFSSMEYDAGRNEAYRV